MILNDLPLAAKPREYKLDRLAIDPDAVVPSGKVPCYTHPPEGGGWHYVVRKGEQQILMYCPLCGAPGYLINHEIDAAGAVRPGVQCPNDECDQVVDVQLNGIEG